jgi:cytochrome c-type biogenesis protein CcmH
LLFFVLRDWRARAPASATAGDPELASVDEVDLAFYRAQLEQELAADDPIFTPQNRMEAG